MGKSGKNCGTQRNRRREGLLVHPRVLHSRLNAAFAAGSARRRAEELLHKIQLGQWLCHLMVIQIVWSRLLPAGQTRKGGWCPPLNESILPTIHVHAFTHT